MVTTKTADNVLKSYYLDVVSDQLNKSTNPLFAAIKQTTADVWGRDVRKSVRFGGNGGIGAGDEDGALPTATGTNYAQFVSTLKNLYGTIEITDKAIRASANNEGAFVNLLNDEMEGLVKSSAFNFSRMLFGDGTGKLETVSMVNPENKKQLGMGSVRNFAEGMLIDIVSPSGEVVDTGVPVIAVDRDNNCITVGIEDHHAATGYTLHLQGSKDKEITGLAAIFGEGPLYGVDRTDNAWLKPYSASASTLTEEKILAAIDAVEEKSGSRPNFIVCSWGVRRALYKLLSENKHVDTVELEGGYRAMSFNGIPVIADRFCPPHTMYILNTNDFALHQLCDWQWLEGEDGKVLKQIAGKPVFTATLVKYAELMCYRPCGQARLTGIIEA